jgi:hypothetical protein
MADLKITDLARASVVKTGDTFYVVQDGDSKQIDAANLFSSISNPTFKGNIFLDTNKQVLDVSNVYTFPITNKKLITELQLFQTEVFPTLENGIDNGQLKIITLVSKGAGGRATLRSPNVNIVGNRTLFFDNIGDTAFFIYDNNNWRILGTSPGFKSDISGYTDDILEAPGTANLYYSNARARAAISAGDVTIIYDKSNGTIKANISYLANLDLRTFTTDDLPQGQANLYFSNTLAINATANARAVLRSQIQKPTANLIWVSGNGDDTLDGRTMANAVANIHVALARANAWTTVRVNPGEYTLHNQPVTIKARVALVGDNLRTTTVRPSQPTKDMFYVENGSYATGFTYRDHVAPAAVFSYNPDGSAGTIVTSPYIQNSSSITTTGTGMRVDGAFVGGLRSMVCDAYTQTNSGGIGIHMLNRGYTQLVSVFTICCNIGILCEAGGFCSITNSNTSFGTYGLVADGVSFPLYTGRVKSQINSRTFLLENVSKRPSIGDAVLFANFDQALCSRDTGLIVDSVAFDAAYTSNSQSTFAGLQYYTQTASSIPGQMPETVAALTYAKSLANVISRSVGVPIKRQSTFSQVFANTAVGTFQTANVIDTDFNLIIDIINNGTVGVTDRIVPDKYPANTATAVQNSSNLLQLNKDFIAAETVAYVNTTYPQFLYDNDKCKRDVGFILDSITFDLRHDGNKQSIQSGVYYYNYNADTTRIVNQVVQTGAAYEYIKSLTQRIVTAQPILTTLQTAVTQNTTAAPAATFAESNFINTKLDLIVNIIENGPAVAPAKTPIELTANTSPNMVNATKLLLSNRDFIKAEVLEYVNSNWATISNGSVQFYTVNSSTPLANVVGGYDQAKCARDVGYIVEAALDDMVLGTNYKSIVAGLAYLRSYSSNVTATVQKDPTIDGINKAKEIVLGYIGDGAIKATVAARISDVTEIINSGVAAVDPIFYAPPLTTPTGYSNAASILQVNKAFIQNEITSWISANEPTIAATYSPTLCARDIGYVLDAFTYDLAYGGTSQTATAANAYYNGAVATLPVAQRLPTANSYNHLKRVVSNVVLNTAIVRSANANLSLIQNRSLGVGSSDSANTLITLSNIIIDFVPDGVYNTSTLVPLSVTTTSYDVNKILAKTAVLNNISTVKTSVINYINVTYPTLGGVGETTIVLDEKLLAADFPRANTRVSFHQRSYISASGQTFEYVGSGNDLATALPSSGGIPIQENEVVELRGGAVYYTSTDHIGDFRIGNEMVINRATGTIIGRTFDKSLFAVLTPYILAIQ